MMENWYVIQVRSGYEEKIKKTCQLIIDKSVLLDCFIPKIETMKKYHGKWHSQDDVLFKGYVFMISDHIDTLFNELKKVPDLTKLLGKSEDVVYPLKEEEVQFLKSFGKDDHFVEMSYGIIEGDTITVLNGPLKGREGMIKKIDRHKRIAIIEVNFFDQITTAKVGLEIIKKNENQNAGDK